MIKIYKAFNNMMETCGISAKELAEVSGVAPSRISQFRNGYFLEYSDEKGRAKGADISSDGLDQLLAAAEVIQPGAARIFCSYLLETDRISLMSLEEIGDQLFILGEKLKQKAKSTKREIMEVHI